LLKNYQNTVFYSIRNYKLLVTLNLFQGLLQLKKMLKQVQQDSIY